MFDLFFVVGHFIVLYLGIVVELNETLYQGSLNFTNIELSTNGTVFIEGNECSSLTHHFSSSTLIAFQEI